MKDTESVRVKVISDGRRRKFVFRWSENGRQRQQASKWPNRKSLRRKAERDAAELERQLNDQAAVDEDLPWQAFELRYTQDHLSSLAKNSGDAWRTAARHVREIIQPLVLSDVDAAALARMAAVLRARGRAETTIDTYVNTVSAALGWAEDMGYLRERPRVRRPKRAKGQVKRMRGRPVSGEEFDRMLAAAKATRPRDTAIWQRLLEGLWLSGLRLSEAIRLSWEFRSEFSVDLAGKTPVFRIVASGHKRATNQTLPMAPDFAEWLQEVPPSQRRGRVFGIDFRVDTACKIVSDIGEAAGIVVSPDGRTATAHDLRRSFGNRWAKRVRAPVLKQLMRHADIKTTETYYLDLTTDEIGEELKSAIKGGANGGASPSDNQTQIAKEHPSR